MKRTIVAVIGPAIIIWSIISAAYEPDTHSRLADDSAANSVIGIAPPAGSTLILPDWGLTTYADPQQEFNDSQSGTPYRIGPPGTATTSMPAKASIEGLIRAGAAIEDDSDRPPCHFFDPTTGLQLNGFGLSINHSNPEWALGSDYGGANDGPCTTTILGSSFLTFSSQPQKYSLTDANKYLYAALTSSDLDSRKQNFGDLFLSVGHTLHLLEDMAQPQHVRNESHCDDRVCLFGLQYQPSKYEADIFFTPYKDIQGNYIPNIKTARGFWVGGGAGLADFTNRNFLSARTLDWVNGTSIGYSSPSLDLAGSELDENVTDVYQQELGKPVPGWIAAYCNSQPKSCVLQLLSTVGNDAYTNGVFVNTKAASESIFNSDLNDIGAHKIYTLNIVTERSAWSFLQPMAIGYGTGLVDYFFRGKLGVQPDPNVVDNYIVSNLSSYELKGRVQFYYDAPDGTRNPVPGSSTQVDLPGMSSSSQAPSAQSIPVIPPAYPAAESTGSYMAVFDGTIGTEPGIAGKHVDANNFYLAIQKYSGYSSYFRCPDGTVQTYTGSGKLIDEADSAIPQDLTELVAVTNGIRFTSASTFLVEPDTDSDQDCNVDSDANNDPKGAPEGPPLYYVMRNGQVLLTFPESTAIDRFAVNDKNLFVSTEVSANSEDIHVYDLNGNPGPVLNVPYMLLTGLSANDSVLCVAGKDENFNGQNRLYSLAGGLVATLKASNDGTNAADDFCASSANRVYVVRQTSFVGVSTVIVDVYDNNGTPITSIPIDGETSSLGLAATDTRLYVTFFDRNGVNKSLPYPGFEQGIAIYQRSVVNGSDNYTLLRKFFVDDMNGVNLERDIAVDMKAVLTGPVH